MIPTRHEGGVEIDGLPGERAQFTIAANGKAFRTLIDGLYSNKIQAVTREIWSNAADSHIAAGIPGTPFKVWVPTEMDPTFRVRDFGTGMTHDEVMHLYTTIFQSSKETTNDQTGMLGLGSKSPFAYTDSFSVTAYDGQEMRFYAANIAADGVPQITHVGTQPSGEPRGIEVSFAVNRSDVRRFKQEAQWISMGFDTKPETVGVDLKMPVPYMAGSNWQVYRATEWGELPSYTLIRQGVACYPHNDGVGLGHNFMVIIDIPIGTADITASREALSYTPATRAAVNSIIAEVKASINQAVKAEIAKAVTRREVAQANYDFQTLLASRAGSTMVSLFDNPAQGQTHTTLLDRRPGDVVHVGSEYQRPDTIRGRRVPRTRSAVEVSTLDRVRLFIDHGGKFVRKRERIRSYCGENDLIVAAEYDDKGVEVAASWVVACLELRPEQVFSIDVIPDPGPTSTRNGYTPREKKILERGQFWMLRTRGKCDAGKYGIYDKGYWGNDNDCEGWPKALRTAVYHLSEKNPVKTADILYVTPKEAERMGLPESRRYDIVVDKALTDEASKLPIDNAIAVITLNESLGHATSYGLVRDQFFAHLTMSTSTAQEVISKARFAQINLTNRAIADTIKSQVRMLTATYPLLFGKNDRSTLEQYIKQVQLAEQATQKEAQPA